MGETDCELLTGGLLVQPVNAWSSLAYLAAAAYVLFRGGRGRTTIAGALALALVGAGSFAFHGPQPPGARVLHDASIVVLLAVVGVRLHRERVRIAAPAAALGLGLLLFVAGRTGAPLCAPTSLLQPHAAWHVLTAAAAALALAGAPARRRAYVSS